MERLTERMNDELNGVWVKDHDYVATAHRLADYEDTGLTPEDVEQLKLASMGKAVAEITEFNGIPINRLRELAEADKDGRAVILPCKSGDELWTFCTYPLARVYASKATDVAVLNGRIMINADDFSIPLSPQDIGKTVFLAREEAERALEVRRDG